MRLLLVSFLLLSLGSFSQSGVVEDLEDDYEGYHFKYVSESMLRAVVSLADTAGTMKELSHGVRSMVIFTLENDEEGVSPDERKNIEEKLQNSEFELLFSQSGGNSEVLVYAEEDEGSITSISALTYSENKLTFIELVATVDLGMLLSGNLDAFESITGNLGGFNSLFE